MHWCVLYPETKQYNKFAVSHCTEGTLGKKYKDGHFFLILKIFELTKASNYKNYHPKQKCTDNELWEKNGSL